MSGILWSKRAHPLENYIRHSLARIARERAGADVQIAHLDVQTFPHFEVRGNGLVARLTDNPGFPPLVVVRSFSVEAGLLGLLFKHFDEVQLDGVQIHVPPKSQRKHAQPQTGNSESRGSPNNSGMTFSIGTIVANGAVVSILGEDGTPGLTFEIHQARLIHFRPNLPVEYFASLTNAKPSGEIQTHGHFGPWSKDEPGETPVSGSYVFSHANLGELKGISGLLSSQGEFRGVLDYLKVNGSTQTPDFALDIAHHMEALNTQFKAIVNGTNGNTILDPIQIQLGTSSLVARGEIARLPTENGKNISLYVISQNARIEDLLRLAVRSKTPFMSGRMQMATSFLLPSRRDDHRPITGRLQMSGVLHARDARFRKDLQAKITKLSRKGGGDPDGHAISSNFAGRFRIRNRAVSFSRLLFSVPGAKVNLRGKYNLYSERLDFKGALSLSAKLSQTTSGWKSLLLKAVDPLFERRNAGAVLPIEISGTRKKPDFKLDLRRILL